MVPPNILPTRLVLALIRPSVTFTVLAKLLPARRVNRTVLLPLVEKTSASPLATVSVRLTVVLDLTLKAALTLSRTLVSVEPTALAPLSTVVLARSSQLETIPRPLRTVVPVVLKLVRNLLSLSFVPLSPLPSLLHPLAPCITVLFRVLHFTIIVPVDLVLSLPLSLVTPSPPSSSPLQVLVSLVVPLVRLPTVLVQLDPTELRMVLVPPVVTRLQIDPPKLSQPRTSLLPRSTLAFNVSDSLFATHVVSVLRFVRIPLPVLITPRSLFYNVLVPLTLDAVVRTPPRSVVVPLPTSLTLLRVVRTPLPRVLAS